jgi:hypothetical protein
VEDCLLHVTCFEVVQVSREERLFVDSLLLSRPLCIYTDGDWGVLKNARYRRKAPTRRRVQFPRFSVPMFGLCLLEVFWQFTTSQARRVMSQNGFSGDCDSHYR